MRFFFLPLLTLLLLVLSLFQLNALSVVMVTCIRVCILKDIVVVYMYFHYFSIFVHQTTTAVHPSPEPTIHTSMPRPLAEPATEPNPPVLCELLPQPVVLFMLPEILPSLLFTSASTTHAILISTKTVTTVAVTIFLYIYINIALLLHLQYRCHIRFHDRCFRNMVLSLLHQYRIQQRLSSPRILFSFVKLFTLKLFYYIILRKPLHFPYPY